MAESLSLPIVDYSSSSDEEIPKQNRKHDDNGIHTHSTQCAHNQLDETDVIPKKRQKLQSCVLPSVPDNILNMFANCDTAQVQENPKDFGGKIRNFAHERGNWASYIYIPVESQDVFLDLSHTLISLLKDDDLGFTPVDDFHLSLSKTFIIRHHWIQPLEDCLHQKLSNCSRVVCSLSDLGVYCNDEGTRSFIGVKVNVGRDEMRYFVEKIDSCLKDFNLYTYYENPSFHVSLLWHVGDVTKKISEKIRKKLQLAIDDFFEENPSDAVLEVQELKFKTGNKIFSIPLKL